MATERYIKNETLGLEMLELSEVIREFRIEKNISQTTLYYGLCTKKQYTKLEEGEAVMDEYLSERLFSRLHIQYRLMDIMLDDDNFWQKECRHAVGTAIYNEAWEKAEVLLDEYEERAPKTELHMQYVLAKRAELNWKSGKESSGNNFLKALEMTMPVTELETRLKKNGVIAEDELLWYFWYRLCEKPFSMEEYSDFLKKVEEHFFSVQIYAEIYFEAAYRFVLMLWQEEQYVFCRKVCQKAIEVLKLGIKKFHLAEFYFYDAIAGMRLRHGQKEEQELFLQCKMAYYTAMSFGKTESGRKIQKYCEEELGWHIIK